MLNFYLGKLEGFLAPIIIFAAFVAGAAFMVIGFSEDEFKLLKEKYGKENN